MNRAYSIIGARPIDVPLIPPIELAAARLLAGHAPATVLDEVTDQRTLHRAQQEGRLWVALAGDTPVGFAHVEVLEPGGAHLAEMDVHPDHGRQGIGTQLISRVCRWAAEVGHSFVSLTTFRDVPWNMPFYAQIGFEEIPPRLLSPALNSVLADEFRRGLDPVRRVAMWRRG